VEECADSLEVALNAAVISRSTFMSERAGIERARRSFFGVSGKRVFQLDIFAGRENFQCLLPAQS